MKIRHRSMITPIVVLAVVLGLAACSSNRSKPRSDPNNPGGSIVEKSAGQTINVDGLKHKVIAFAGYLEIDPYPTGKGVQGTRIITKDGVGYLLAIRRYRPYLKYVNRWVTGTGYHYQSSNDPRAQSIGLFKTLSLRLADGQKPHATLPTRVPSPPLVRSQAELDRLPGRWALIVAKPTFKLKQPLSTDTPYHTVRSVTLTLPGAPPVTKYLYQFMSKRSARRFVAQTKATLVVRLQRNGTTLKIRASTFCEGEYLRCGMERRSPRYLPTLVENYLDGSWRVAHGTKSLGALTLYERT